MHRSIEKADKFIVTVLREYAITSLRISLAIVFIWFGLLKIFDISPVSDLVARTVYWFPPEYFVPFLGVWETLVGLGLLFKVMLRATLVFFFLQMAGTFLVLVMHPNLAFQQGNPFLLTTIGEFVVKNLVLLTAGIVIGSTLKRQHTH